MKRLAVLVLVAAAVGAFLKRPVKQPAPTGVWDPAEHQPTHR